MSPRKRVIKNLAEMEELAREVAAQVKPGETLLLEGELGTGKTTFTKALAQALGASQAVSPTFTVAAEYEVDNDSGIVKIVHLDLYRFEGEAARKDPLIRELIGSERGAGRLTVVEWADRLGIDRVAGARVIRFEHGEKPNERVVTIRQ